MSEPRLTTTDYHTGGEPFRIVTSPLRVDGETVADRRMAAIASPDLQRTRRILCSEPRGHADMYGCFITPPDDAGADFGALFWHKDGFSTACGHGTIALGTWAVDTGLVDAEADGVTDVVIDVPSGRVTARVTCAGGRVASVAFVNVASWVSATEIPVELGDRTVHVDVAYGGAFYACLPAADLGLAVEPSQYAALVAAGRHITRVAGDLAAAQHPGDERLSGVYGTILYEPIGADGDRGRSAAVIAGEPVRQRNLTIFADGEADRSPCGSGTCARMALLAGSGTLTMANSLIHTSIVGSTFTGRIRELASEFGRQAIVPEVVGSAYKTGESAFVVDDRDELAEGFVLR